MRRLDLLTSPLFLTALTCLLLNDLCLKTAFPGLLTGKLSDFSGLFAFTLALCAFFPRCSWIFAHCAALGFVYWKSPASQSLINILEYFEIPLGRVCDSSDLAAVPMAYAAALYARISARKPFTLAAVKLSLCAAALAFGATSYKRPLTPEEQIIHDELLVIWPRSLRTYEFRDDNDATFAYTRDPEWLLRYVTTLGFNSSVSYNAFTFEKNFHINGRAHECQPYAGGSLLRDQPVPTQEQELERAQRVPLLIGADFNVEGEGAERRIQLYRLLICSFKGSDEISKPDALREFELLLRESL